MRISSAPSMIRKRAAAFDVEKKELSQKKKVHIPGLSILREVAKENCRDSSVCVQQESIFTRQVYDEQCTGEFRNDENRDPDVSAKSIESLAGVSCESRPGKVPVKRKARLGVGFVKPRFMSHAPALVATHSVGSLARADVAATDLVVPNSGNLEAPGVDVKADGQNSASYFSVMYCPRKLNAKCKGPWSDGVVILQGRSCTLQDTEGKVVMRDNCHRCGDKTEGTTFQLGKYEVEMVRRSSAEEFRSGQIFTDTVKLQLDNVVAVGRKRTFKRPVIKASGTTLPSQLKIPRSFASFHNSSQICFGAKGDIKDIDERLILNPNEIRRGYVPVTVDPYLVPRLRDHQKAGVIFMYECVMGLKNNKFTGCLLADAMGLGKTLQVIALIWTLLHQGPTGHPTVRRVLVVCPSSLVENWGKEVRKWLGTERLNVLLIHSGMSSKDAKLKIAAYLIGKIYPVLVTSYELLRKYHDDLSAAKPELLVCDEAHRLKNCAGNKTIDALLGLNCSMKVLLTGTPVQNDLMEFYAMVDFANKGLLGSSSVFKRMYADPIEKSRDRNATAEEKNHGLRRSAELQLRTRPYILQRSSDVNLKYLPRKTELLVFCKLQELQVSMYQRFLTSQTIESMLSRSNQSAVILAAIGALRKLCNHPKLVYEISRDEDIQVSKDVTEEFSANRDTEGPWTMSGKLLCLYHMISALHAAGYSCVPDKIVVVSNFTQTLDIIQTLCEEQKWKWLRLDGSTSVCERQIIVDRFNGENSKERVFLLSARAGGAGLNLIGANRLVLFDPDWNPATDAQAMARVWRDGQKKPVYIYRLLSTGSIEEKIYQRQILKQEVAAAVGKLSHDSHAGRHFSREELRELFVLRLDTRCDTYDLLAQSTGCRVADWRDSSAELQDYALEKAIQTGVVTFTQKYVEEGKLSIVDSDAYKRNPQRQNGEFQLREDKCLVEEFSAGRTDQPDPLVGNSETCSKRDDSADNVVVCVDQWFTNSEMAEQVLPSELENSSNECPSQHQCCMISGSPLVGHTEPQDQVQSKNSVVLSELCQDTRVCMETNQICSISTEKLPEISLSVDPVCPSATSVMIVEEHFDETVRCYEGEEPSLDGMQSLRCEVVGVESDETSSPSSRMSSICLFDQQCQCTLGARGHKLLRSVLETMKLSVVGLEDVEVLDIPFVSSLELELELDKLQFKPQKLWEGFKLFVCGYMLGNKEKQIHYRCCTLGLILEKCNGDKSCRTETVFCKGLPLVINALSRQHGSEAVSLRYLLSVNEDERKLSSTQAGRILIDVTNRVSDFSLD